MHMGNVSEKRAILKDIDKGFDITFNPENEMFTITHKDHVFMNVKYGEFERSTVEHIRKMKYLNENGLLEEDMDRNNAIMERSKERKTELLAETLAKDIRKPLIKDYYGY